MLEPSDSGRWKQIVVFSSTRPEEAHESQCELAVAMVLHLSNHRRDGVNRTREHFEAAKYRKL